MSGVWLDFAGWFQCRLPTDPDPSDEPRGVSGYAQALAGEPDLDRVIRLQSPGSVQRAFCPTPGVAVTTVVVDGIEQPEHPLIEARVDLLDDPVFEGRNGIVADDGFEPIVPFHLRVSKGSFDLQRRHLDVEAFPYDELRATGVQPGLTDVVEATGIYDLWQVWEERKRQVDAALAAGPDEVSRAALTRRSQMLSRQGLTGFFAARMMYSIPLGGSFSASDPDGWLPGPVVGDSPWLADFWFGGWDADAFCGFMKGTLQFEAGPAGAAAPPRLASAAVQDGASSMFAPAPAPARDPRRP